VVVLEAIFTIRNGPKLEVNPSISLGGDVQTITPNKILKYL